MIVDSKDLINIRGGATTFSGSYINSISRLINVLLDFGRSIGSALRYHFSGKSC